MAKRLFVLALLMSLFGASMVMGAAQGEAAATQKMEPAAITVLSHRVHEKIATDPIDFITPWIERTPSVTAVNWNTQEIGPLHDRLFREASLPSTEVAVSYLLNTYALPRVANLLEPLDDYLAKMPIDDFENQFPQGMVASLTFNGKIYGIPMRAAPSALWYNKAIFREVGLTRPPQTRKSWWST